MFNVDSRQLEKMMKQMGINHEVIDADRVIIEGTDRNIVITNPNVTKIIMAGKESFQVVGNVQEEGKEKFTIEDVQTVMDQTGCSKEDAVIALEEKGDIAGAILKLK